MYAPTLIYSNNGAVSVDLRCLSKQLLAPHQQQYTVSVVPTIFSEVVTMTTNRKRLRTNNCCVQLLLLIGIY
jgi:hypothetical protein